MKPDYDAMTKSELRAYILQHRDDLDALEAFFARRSPDSEATWYTLPKTEEEWQQQMEMVRPILERKPKADNQQ
jgi:erythromycin esterase-like protein